MKNVTEIRSMGNNARSTRRVTKKRFSGRRKNEKEIEKKNVDVSEEIYHDEPFFGDDTIACENKTINK